MTRAFGVGAGGHARVVLEIVRAAGVEVVGFVDPRRDLWGSHVAGVPVLGDDELLDPNYDGGVSAAFIGVGGATGTAARRRLFALVEQVGLEPLSAVHGTAVVSPSAALGAGVTICAAAVVNAGAAVGANAVVNTAAVVEHDCSVGAHAHVATGARLTGGVVVEDGAFVGAGATVVPGVRVGAEAVVGAGAVVTADVAPGTTVVGVPARPTRAERA